MAEVSVPPGRYPNILNQADVTKWPALKVLERQGGAQAMQGALEVAPCL